MALRFGGFIITFDRPLVLQDTIRRVLSQSAAPSKLLVIDNGSSEETSAVISEMNNPSLEYLRVGYNAGPAGGAAIGLRKLAGEGYDWIFWGDDNDPPRFEDCFATLLAKVNGSIGAIGAVGSMFDWRTGLRKRYPDSELHGLLPVDSIGGGFCFIINAKAIDEQTLPDAALFFGLEEFDFCQKLIKKGLRVYVDGELLYRYRLQSNNLGIEKKPSIIPRRTFSTLHRDYYSYRNAIYLMMHQYGKTPLAWRYVLRCLSKIPFGFAKGIGFGIKNAKMLSLAVFHGLTKRMGKTY